MAVTDQAKARAGGMRGWTTRVAGATAMLLLAALAVGLRMIRGIVFGWSSRTSGRSPMAKPSPVLQ